MTLLSFQEAFGLPPKAYLKALRLNGVRSTLLHAEPSDYVSGIASRWGFLHFGWFSVDYRHLFGERPSETLAKALAARSLQGPRHDVQPRSRKGWVKRGRDPFPVPNIA